MTPDDIWFGQNSRAGSGHTHGWGFSIKPRAPFFRPSAAVLLLRLAWQQSSHYGRDLALLPKEHFSFYSAAVRTFEAVDCQISANWMWPDHAGVQRLAAFWAYIVHKEIKGQGVKLDPSTLSLINAA
jgi:hypothetical protein